MLIGAAGFAASLTALYMAMRDLMLNSGGFCASGGPYQINPGQVCESGQVGLLMGGVFGLLIFGGLLIAASGWFGGWRLSGVGLLLWAALFGALGWNFIDLGVNPPEHVSGSVGWLICGVVFWLMALGGLIPGLLAIGSSFKNADKPDAEVSSFKEPLVRANVAFTRSMPGDPAFGTDRVDAASDASAARAPERTAGLDEDFIDPVTGERHGGNDG